MLTRGAGPQVPEFISSLPCRVPNRARCTPCESLRRRGTQAGRGNAPFSSLQCKQKPKRTKFQSSYSSPGATAPGRGADGGTDTSRGTGGQGDSWLAAVQRVQGTAGTRWQSHKAMALQPPAAACESPEPVVPHLSLSTSQRGQASPSGTAAVLYVQPGWGGIIYGVPGLPPWGCGPRTSPG